jgi:FimV-like protein
LLELYLSANRIEAANLVYAKLDQSLDSDSSLRGNLIDICKEYDFVPHAGLAVAATEVASSKLATELMLDEPEVLIPSVADLSAQEKEQLLKKLTPELIHEQAEPSDELNELSHEIDFTPQELVAPDVAVDALGADFASERVMDFSGFNQVSSSSVEAADTHGVPANVSEVAVDRLTHHEWSDSDLQVINSTLQDDTRLDVDANLDEKLNLAQMYYQIEELAKAREILIELVNAPGGNSSTKVQAQQLLTDLGLND